MRRREFVALAGGALVTWPVATVAQQPAFPRIGLLLANDGPARNAILRSLAERGYVDGKTAKIEQRHAEGRLERLPELGRELAAIPVDLIIAVAASATVAAGDRDHPNRHGPCGRSYRIRAH